VPTALFSFVDNQIAIRRYFGRAGAMIDCGDVRMNRHQCLNDIIKAIKSMADAKRRAEMRQKGRRITDGRGAWRIARHVMASL
jgi:spore coat polysaccharide biosynthesis predicted glycosyltransferase SpsG